MLRLVSGIYLLLQITTATDHSTWKVMNGTFASILDYPYHAFIAVIGLTKGEDSPIALKNWGGAVLINSYWLLTAAHVMLDNERVTGGRPIYKVRLGVDDLTQTGLVADVELYRCHTGFSRQRLVLLNDICLVKTRQMVQFSDRVRPVALPVKDEEMDYKSEKAKFAGFGDTLDPKYTFEHLRLRVVDMEILDLDWCDLSGVWDVSLPIFCTALGIHPKENYLYGGAFGSGDSGSGLVTKRKSTGELVLLGICSSSVLYGDVKIPAIDHYVRVSHFIDWIFENMC